MDLVPVALTPSGPDLFDPPTDNTLVDQTQFLRTNGSLVFLLPIRHDIRKEVVFLCSRNSSPTVSDLTKQTRLLRYLKGCPDIGPTFSSSTSSHPHGVTILAAADSSHACHTDGRSQTAYTIQIGNHNAPFLAHSTAEPSGVALSPCEAEYIALGRCAKDGTFYRQFAKRSRLSSNTTNNNPRRQSTRNKFNSAPQITRKSRHIAIRHHYLRWLYQTKQISPKHQGTNDLIPDGLTKSLPPTKFLWFRSQLLNIPQAPHVT